MFGVVCFVVGWGIGFVGYLGRKAKALEIAINEAIEKFKDGKYN